MPESSVVLACLSRNNKFEPEAYDDWMAILSRHQLPTMLIVPPGALTPWERFQLERLGPVRPGLSAAR